MWLADLLFARLGRQRYRRILDRIDVEARRVSDLAEMVDDLARRTPGRCGECGRQTDSADVFWCSHEHQVKWNARRAAG